MISNLVTVGSVILALVPMGEAGSAAVPGIEVALKAQTRTMNRGFNRVVFIRLFELKQGTSNFAESGLRWSVRIPAGTGKLPGVHAWLGTALAKCFRDLFTAMFRIYLGTVFPTLTPEQREEMIPALFVSVKGDAWA